MDQETLNPIGIFVTLSEQDAKSWEARLRHMDGAARQPTERYCSVARRNTISTGNSAERVGWGSAMAHGI